MNTKLIVEYDYMFDADEEAMSELIDTDEFVEDDFNSKPYIYVYEEDSATTELITFLEYEFRKIAVDVKDENIIYVSENFDINTTYKPEGGEYVNLINVFNSEGKTIKAILQKELDEMFRSYNKRTYR